EDVTQLLAALSEGRDSAADALIPIVYDELRKLAASLLKGERRDHTLQTTALVHEAYLKLVRGNAARWKDRTHFFAIAAQAMRRILVDHARARNRKKRGGAHAKVSNGTIALLDKAGLIVDPDSSAIDLIALDEALEKLGRVQPQAARVVEMRYFA